MLSGLKLRLSRLYIVAKLWACNINPYKSEKFLFKRIVPDSYDDFIFFEDLEIKLLFVTTLTAGRKFLRKDIGRFGCFNIECSFCIRSLLCDKDLTCDGFILYEDEFTDFLDVLYTSSLYSFYAKALLGRAK